MARKVECICNFLEEINEFFSIGEFERFQRYLKRILNEGDLEEVQVKEYYSGFEEHWYKCKDCQQVWRLVHPDFPFKGMWQKVGKNV